VLVQPSKVKEIKVPAEYMEVERQVLLVQERMVWQRVLCDTNVTKAVVADVQSRLKKKGFPQKRSEIIARFSEPKA